MRSNEKISLSDLRAIVNCLDNALMALTELPGTAYGSPSNPNYLDNLIARLENQYQTYSKRATRLELVLLREQCKRRRDKLEKKITALQERAGPHA